MFKLGIHSVNQLLSGRKNTIFGAKKKVSATLLDKIDAGKTDSDAYAAILFYLNDDKGAYKRTYAGRFDEFDDKCIEIIEEAFRGPHLNFHDVAVSSGQTSVDFYEKLNPKYEKLLYLASDYDPYLTVLRHGPLHVTISSTGSIVEILLAPFVFSQNPPDRWFYPVNRLLHFIARKYWAKPLVANYLAGKLSKQHTRTIDVFCPKARQLADANEGFTLGQHNLLEPSKTTADCLRAMNVLNDSYFSEDQMMTILQSAYDSLVEKGLLIFGSNQDAGSSVSGAVYAKTDRGFNRVWVTAVEPSASKHIVTFNRQFG